VFNFACANGCPDADEPELPEDGEEPEEEPDEEPEEEPEEEEG
jgi:hypothetical protein